MEVNHRLLPKGMAAPKRRLVSKDRKQQILDNAARLFAIYGLDGTSMRDVAKACKVNEALLYKHFESKQELFREVVLAIQREIEGPWRKIADWQPNGIAALRAVLKALLFGPIEELHAYSYLVHGMAASSRDRSVKPLVEAGFAQLHAFLAELVKRGIEDGSIKSVADPQRCAWCVLSRGLVCSMVSGVMPESCLLPPKEEYLPDMLVSCIEFAPASRQVFCVEDSGNSKDSLT
jgi:AcrR family transcriptional regulator